MCKHLLQEEVVVTSIANLPLAQLMEVHIHTLYCSDSEGRLRAVNEIGKPPAPLFYLGRTLQGNFWRVRHDLPAALVEELEKLLRAEPVATNLAVPPQNYMAIKHVLHELVPLPQQCEYRGPAYWIPPDATKASHLLPNVQLIDKTQVALVQHDFPWLPPLLLASDEEDELGPVVAAVEDGRAVALCHCARRPGVATEAGVETVAAFRGKGFATATVALWAAAVRQRGCLPMYSTAWKNLASQAIARKLQMVCYGEDWAIQ